VYATVNGKMGTAKKAHHPYALIFKTSAQISNTTHVQKVTEAPDIINQSFYMMMVYLNYGDCKHIYKLPACTVI
jgi:hypothetical protein